MSLILAVGEPYRSVVIALMLAEANLLVEKLNLPEERPIRVKHLRLAFVAPQNSNRAGEVRGTIETERFLYAFARSNKLTSLGQLYLPLSARFTDQERDAEARRRAIPLSQVKRKAHQVICVGNVQFVDGHVELVRSPDLWMLTWNVSWVPGPEPRRGGFR